MHKSDSTEQRDAETYILLSLEAELSATFDPAARLPISSRVQPDAIDPVKKIIVEVYARVGPVKGAQLHKIKGDVLKLALIGQQAGPDWRRILCFASEEAAAYVTGQSWVAAAVKHFGIEVIVAPLSDEHRERVASAQARQRMVNPE
ncbi:hypothetical protein [Thioalkalivibrio sp. ALJT]|uniref:hypothetical protein n=1 Tax=Thioalkalivibrio sp. ALJT TaxID=1158146 RepID=UPI0012DEE5F1|nr:hypothetical protein [Thioalkalivibrio sp. ALJT]